MWNEIGVCMVTGRFYPEYGGGARQALRICQKTRERGIVPFVVTRDYHHRFSMFDIRKDLVFGIQVFRLPSVFRKGRWSKLWFVVRALIFLVDHRARYHIVHIHGIRHYTFPIILLAKAMKKNVIVKMTCFGIDDPLTLKKKRLGATRLKIMSLADRVIGVSSELCASYKQSPLSSKKLVYIPNGIDMEEFHPVGKNERLRLKKKLGITPEYLVFLFIGGVIRRKGVDLLVKSWGKVIKNFPFSKLIIIGPKDEKDAIINEKYLTENLWQYLKDRQLDNTVIFTGYLTDVKEYIQICDIFILPSSKEALPTVLIEAMACGTSIVATRLGCVLDLIEDGKSGLLFELRNQAQLTECLMRLAGEPDLRKAFSKECRRTVNRFSFNRIADSYISIYEGLLTESYSGKGNETKE